MNVVLWSSIISATAAISAASLTQLIGVRAQRKAQRAEWAQQERRQQHLWEHEQQEQAAQRSRAAIEATFTLALELQNLLSPRTAASPDPMGEEIQNVREQTWECAILIREPRVRDAVHRGTNAMVQAMARPQEEWFMGSLWREDQRIAGAIVDLLAAFLRGESIDEPELTIMEASDAGIAAWKARQGRGLPGL